MLTDRTPAALENAEDVTGRHHLPCRQRIKFGQCASRLLFIGELAVGRGEGRDDLRRFTMLV
jgi:hypothetical protein